MRHSIKRIIGSALVIAAGACPSLTQATDTVHSGWDLFLTQPGTEFMSVPFMGVPLGTYDFGGTIGVQNVGQTDTIVQRLANVSAPGGTTPLVISALQLETTAPVSFLGGPFGPYYLTLQSVRGGPASTGQATINFGPNTFNSFFDIFYDVRFGALNGPIVNTGDLVLTSTGGTWQHPALGYPLIPGVNYLLDGTDPLEDFFPVGTITHINNSGPGDQHVVSVVPEPGTGLLAVLGVGLLGLHQHRRKFSR
jgi:MYXO-CTERM domain-containing protein